MANSRVHGGWQDHSGGWLVRSFVSGGVARGQGRQTLGQADLGGQGVEQVDRGPTGRFEVLEVIRMKAGMSNREALPALRHA